MAIYSRVVNSQGRWAGVGARILGGQWVPNYPRSSKVMGTKQAERSRLRFAPAANRQTLAANRRLTIRSGDEHQDTNRLGSHSASLKPGEG
jgi:hypothetical protein